MMVNTLLVYIFCATSFLCVSSNAITDSVIVPCRKDDDACMLKSANIVIPLIAAGIPKLNVPSIDPINPGNMDGELPNVNYKLKDNVISGYGKCEISELKLMLDSMKLNFILNCPSLLWEGLFDFSSKELNVKGMYKIVLGKYMFDVKADIEKVTGSDGENHMSIKTYKVAGQKLEPVKLYYENIVSGDTTAPENDVELLRKKIEYVSYLIKDAYIGATFSAIFKNVNILLQAVPFDDLFIN